MNSRASVWIAGSGTTLAAVLLVGSVWAQETRFDPSVALRYGYNSNVRFVAIEGSGDAEDPDTTIGLTLALPVRRSWRNSNLRFRYDLNGQRYSENTEFDDVAHRLRLEFFQDTRRGNRWRVYADAIQTQEQGAVPGLPAEIRPGGASPPSRDSVSQTLTERVLRRTFNVQGIYPLRIASRWQLDLGAGAGATIFEDVPGEDEPSDPAAAIEDKRQYYGSLTLQRQASRRSRFSVGYRYDFVDLEFSNDEIFQSMDVRWDYDATRRLVVELRLGAFQRSVADSDVSETGTTGAVIVRFNEGLVAGPIRINFDVGASPSGGGSLIGTALSTYGGVTFSGVRTQPWNWRIPWVYERRIPFDDQLATTNTASAAAIVERSVTRALGFRFGTRYVEQRSDDEALEGSFYRADVYLVWYVLSGHRISGRR